MIQYQTLTLIGTSHISPESIVLVRRTIQEVQPSFVALELDKGRLLALLEKKRKMRWRDVQKLGVKGFLFALIGAWVEQKLGKMVGEMKLQSAVRFVGSVSDEERAAYFALCDLFVMPSRQIGPDVEGFGLVFLEAALFGKSAIGGRSGGILEAVLDGKTGAIVDPLDPAAFARVVVQLLRDEAQRYEFGQNAKARVLHEFRWEKQIEKLLKVMA